MAELPARIKLITDELFRRLPHVEEHGNYTIGILLWTDDTCKIEARHGSKDGNIHTVTWYDNKVYYETLPALTNVMSVDESGNKFYVLTPEEKAQREAAYTCEIVE